MTNIYLVRHGQSIANAQNIKQNLDEYDLTELGVEQCELVSLEASPDLVFSSPMKRSLKTAEILTKDLEREIIVDDRLIEWQVFPELSNYTLTKQKRAEINPYFLKYDLDEKYGEGESFNDIHTRLNEFIKDSIEKEEGKNILIVSHAGAINHLIYLFTFGYNQSPNDHYEFFLKLSHIKNCGVTKIVRKNDRYVIEYFNK